MERIGQRNRNPERQMKPGERKQDPEETDGVVDISGEDDSTDLTPVHSYELQVGTNTDNINNSNNSPVLVNDTNNVDDAIVVEDYDDGSPNHDTSDVIITNVGPATDRIRPAPQGEFARDVRRRLNDGSSSSSSSSSIRNNSTLDDDIQILDERQLTPPPPPPPLLIPPSAIHIHSRPGNNGNFRTNTPSLRDVEGSLASNDLFTNPEQDHDGTGLFRRELLRRYPSISPILATGREFLGWGRDNPLERFLNSIQLVNSQGQLAQNQRNGRRSRDNRTEGNDRRGDDIISWDNGDASGPEAIFNFIGIGGFNSLFDGENQQERSIMNVIERDNERALDRKLQDENKYNRKALKEKKDQIKREVPGYTSDVKSDENVGCELCGITLGEGIPEDFKATSQYNLGLEKYIEQFNVRAPWFCFKTLTDVDKELSKRVFLSKCGHLYCGRCIKNIGNRPRRRLRKEERVLTIENPDICSPVKCPSLGCAHTFKGKRSFTELYF